MNQETNQTAVRLVDSIITIFLVFITICPMAVLAYLGLTSEWSRNLSGSLTFSWLLMIPERFSHSIGNSLILAAITMIGTLTVSSITAYALATRRVKATKLVDALMMMPLTVSYIVLGLALILTYNRPPLALHGTVWLVAIGHLVISLPMSYRVVQGVMEGVDFSLLEAAKSLGASERVAVSRVILPTVAPGLVASGLLAFVNSLQNYSMSLMVAPEDFKTLPLDLVGFIFSETGSYTNFNLAAAASLFMMLVIVAGLWGVKLITKQTWFENLNF